MSTLLTDRLSLLLALGLALAVACLALAPGFQARFFSPVSGQEVLRVGSGDDGSSLGAPLSNKGPAYLTTNSKSWTRRLEMEGRALR